MKLLITTLFLSAFFCFVGCNQSSSKPNPTDSLQGTSNGISTITGGEPILTFAEYVDPNGYASTKTRVWRSVKDSAFQDRNGQWHALKDTSYFYPITVPILDSLKKQPKKDSLGNVQYTIKWAPLAKECVIYDYNKKFAK